MPLESAEATPLTPRPPFYSVPIKDRPPLTVLERLRTLAFNVVFFTSCIIIHSFQLLVVLPLRAVPLPVARRAYRRLLLFSKEAFGTLLVALSCSGSFGPTSFVLTADESFDLSSNLVRDASGRAVGLNLAKQSREHCFMVESHDLRRAYSRPNCSYDRKSSSLH
jgi:hypothetical protein